MRSPGKSCCGIKVGAPRRFPVLRGGDRPAETIFKSRDLLKPRVENPMLRFVPFPKCEFLLENMGKVRRGRKITQAGGDAMAMAYTA